MMNTDFLIVGQGIAGTLLSYLLIREGRSVYVIDRKDRDAASRVAGAVINPVAVKNLKPVEGQDKFIPLALSLYRDMGQLLNADLITALPIYVFDDLPGEVHTIRSDNAFSVFAGREEVNRLSAYFSFVNPPKKIRNTWLVNAETLLQRWREYLLTRECLAEQNLDLNDIRISEAGYRWGSVQARHIVFCEGACGRTNPFFPRIPFNRNRGDALILEIPGLPENAICHSVLRLVPKGNQQFWYGSNYQWNYDNLEPDLNWREKSLQHLNHWLKLPYIVKEHRVAERPTTAGQVPVMNFHPDHPNMIMFNGLGTKGYSRGPALAMDLCRQLTGR